MKKRWLPVIIAIGLLLALVPLAASGADGPESVAATVYFTLSNDGNFVVGNDPGATVLARVPVTVEYFDLEDYGLEDFHRYEADSFENGGGYIGTTVIRWPTLLHLYIQALEDYYLMDDLVVWESLPVDAEDMAHNPVTGGDYALYITGSPTSMYMEHFWGHDQNLMYYVNHRYPLMAAGWGSTADYILLEDGMEIDVAMFTDWTFYTRGAFAYFVPSSTTVMPGDSVDFQALKSLTIAAQDGSSLPPEPVSGLDIAVYNENWVLVESGITTDAAGEFSYTFLTEGIYHVAGYDTDAGTDEACIAPAIATITVSAQGAPENRAPVVSGSAPTEISGAMDDAHNFNLAAVFSDPDLDPLTYTVSIDEGDAQSIPSSWSFVPQAVGIYTLEFYAYDGQEYSDPYIVTFTAGAPDNYRPVIKSGVTNPQSGAILLGDTLYIDLTEVFEDPDQDEMTFEVSVNGSDYAPVEDEEENPSDVYAFTPTGWDDYEHNPHEVNYYTLRFRASDGSKTSAQYVMNFDLVRLLGDVNFSGTLTYADAMLILNYLSESITFTAAQMTAADYNRDGFITFADAMLILNAIGQ